MVFYSSYLNKYFLNDRSKIVLWVFNFSDRILLKYYRMEKFTINDIFEFSEKNIISLALCSDNSSVACGLSDGILSVFNISSNSIVFSKQIHQKSINSLFWSTTNEIISASEDSTIKVVDDENGNVKAIYHGHDGPILSLAVSRTNYRIASGGMDGIIKIWEPGNQTCLFSYMGNRPPIVSLQFTQNERFLLSLSADGLCTIYDLIKRIPIKSYQNLEKSLGLRVGSAQFSPNEKYILFSCLNSSLYLVDIDTAETVRKFKGHLNQFFCCICGFLNGRQCYIIDENGILFIYDLQTASIIQQFETQGKQRIPLVSSKSSIVIGGGPTNSTLKLICF